MNVYEAMIIEEAGEITNLSQLDTKINNICGKPNGGKILRGLFKIILSAAAAVSGTYGAGAAMKAYSGDYSASSLHTAGKELLKSAGSAIQAGADKAGIGKYLSNVSNGIKGIIGVAVAGGVLYLGWKLVSHFMFKSSSGILNSKMSKEEKIATYKDMINQANQYKSKAPANEQDKINQGIARLQEDLKKAEALTE